LVFEFSSSVRLLVDSCIALCSFACFRDAAILAPLPTRLDLEATD